jgi:hypothetical protein|tara:strand:+ start:265 stop:1152 length:888 start_codon:yes stop_codon:yes gene_type:complete
MKGKDMSKTMEAYLSMVSEAKAKLDPVDDKANDKKFKDRKDKDIDNDGDVDSSDKFLHKKRKAIDNEIDGGEKPADNAKPKKGVNPFKKEEVEIDEARQMKDPKKDSMVTKGNKTIVIDKSKEAEYLKKGWTLSEAQDDTEAEKDDKKPFPPKKKKEKGGADDGETEAEAEDDEEAPADTDGEPENDDPKKKKKSGNPKTDDGTAEISKIESTNHKAFIEMWSQIEEAVSGGAKPAPAEKIDDKESPKGKEFIAKHKIDKKEVEDLQGVEKPKEVKLKKEASEFEVIRALLSGKL